MKNNHFFEILIGFAFALLVLLYFVDLQTITNGFIESYMNNYTIVRNGLPYIESMVDMMPQEIAQPYSLLNGVLPIKDIQTGGMLNSQTCYEGDFQTRLEKTGNFKQLTNNYKHADAESCTAPLQEFVTAYYNVEPLV
jgi:hypothetical protein